MSAGLLAVAVACLVVWAAFEMRPFERTLTNAHKRAVGVSPLLQMGDAIANVGRHRFGSDLWGLSADERKYVGAVGLLVVPTALVAPVLVLALVAGGPAVVWARRRSARVRRHRALLEELPLVVELCSLLVACGYNIPLALRELTACIRGPLAAEIAGVLEDVERGRRLADALDALPARTCEEIRPFVWSLTSAERYGAPLGDVLDRLSLETRTLLANRAESSARKLTVQLLVPVAGTTLPAFALLTVAPFVVSSFRTVTAAFN